MVRMIDAGREYTKTQKQQESRSTKYIEEGRLERKKREDGVEESEVGTGDATIVSFRIAR